MVDRVFYNVAPAVPEGETGTPADSKSLLIEVSNGGNVIGLAGRVSEKLAAEGYRMAEATTYNGEQKIQVKEAGAGSDLVQYFNKAEVEIAPSEIGANADIRIILGTNEQ